MCKGYGFTNKHESKQGIIVVRKEPDGVWGRVSIEDNVVGKVDVGQLTGLWSCQHSEMRRQQIGTHIDC